MLPRRRLIEELDRVAFDAGTQVRIAHRHLDRRVTEELLDSFQWHAPHHEVRCKGVPERMPAEVAQLHPP